jgi:hypothetical protein
MFDGRLDGGRGSSSGSSSDSDSTTGNVMARRKILGADITLTNLSQILLSRHVYNVGKRVDAITCGLGNIL